jgi:cyclic pyranopterin phosphate synthase
MFAKAEVQITMQNQDNTLLDTRNRLLRDLRVSVTDRCNFRCSYCMPKELFGRDHPFLPREELLSFEEIARLVRIFQDLGVKKVRLTGGEPLLRKQVERLVSNLAKIPELELSMTTNASLLPKKARLLKESGLDRVSISLDSLDDEVFKVMNDVDVPVDVVLAGIHSAEQAGLTPIKVNMVVKRGINEDSILPMVEHFRGSGHILRFIEFMDVGSTNGWRLDDVVPVAEILAKIAESYPLKAIEPNYVGEVARRYSYEDGIGEIGLIASVTQPFCGDCSRARLSADGKLFTCLFAVQGVDLKSILRGGANDDALRTEIEKVWIARSDRYSEIRSEATEDLPKVEMSYIGG